MVEHWNTCFRLACSTPAPVGNVEQEFPSTKNGLLYISGFSGETKVLSRHITPLQKWTFVFLRACFVAGSHSAYVCACQVPHFLEASGSYNPKSAPKKAGWVPWFCRGNILLHFWQVPHSVRAWGPQKQIWLYRMGTPNPPSAIFGGIFFVSFLMLDIHGYPNIWYNSVSRIILKWYFRW